MTQSRADLGPVSAALGSRNDASSSTRAPRPPRNTPSAAIVLCIEDDPETASLLVEELNERGYQARVRTDGAEGLAAILEEAPDIVLCDISMPKMSGFEILDRLRQSAPTLEGLPFVFLTALADRQSELRGRRLGADDYVVKPIDFEHLDAIIITRLKRSGWRPRKGDEVALTDREVESLIWSARGKTSDETAAILGLTRRTVDFHLSNARSKLGVATRTQAVARAIADRLIKP